MANNFVTPLNRSPLVHILTWFFFFVGVFFLAVRQVTRRALSSPFKIEDGFIVAAAIISFGQSIAVSVAAANGVGKPLHTLQESQVEVVLKSEYAATVLLIISLAASKLSAVIFTKDLSPDTAHWLYSNILSASVVIWMVIGTLTSLFQCAPPRTWDYLKGNHCINLGAWWIFIAVGNMLTDVAIVVVQSLLLWGLQVSIQSKILLVAIFSSRLLVVGAAVGQVVVSRSDMNNPDVTLKAWLPVVLVEIVQSLAITTTCVPHTKRFLENLESGMIRVEDPEEERRGVELQASKGSSRSARTAKPNLSYGSQTQ